MRQNAPLSRAKDRAPSDQRHDGTSGGESGPPHRNRSVGRPSKRANPHLGAGDAREAFQRGSAFSDAGDFERAHRAFHEAAEEFLKESSTEEAVNAYLRALEARPGNHETMAALAYLCAEGARSEGAIEIVRRAAEGEPPDVSLLTLLGELYLSRG